MGWQYNTHLLWSRQEKVTVHHPQFTFRNIKLVENYFKILGTFLYATPQNETSMAHHSLGTEKGTSATDESGDPAYLTTALLNTATSSSKWDCSPRNYWWFQLSPLAIGLWSWEDVLKPLTLLHCSASCLKTDSSAQALVIFQGLEALQNNSFLFGKGRNGLKQNHHP